jgi:hypothetical protein
VLANIQVYRARLGESQTALRLNDDILRARGMIRADALPTSVEFARSTDAIAGSAVATPPVMTVQEAEQPSSKNQALAALPSVAAALTLPTVIAVPDNVEPVVPVTAARIAPITRERARVGSAPAAQPVGRTKAGEAVSNISTFSLQAPPPVSPGTTAGAPAYR